MKTFIVIILLAVTSFTAAQSVGASFIIGSPQGEFRSYVNRLGFGAQIYGTLWAPSKERPLTIGLDFSYMVYGHYSERSAWDRYYGAYLNFERSNNIASGHVLFQLSPLNGDVRPYIEGLFGGAYIFTESSIKSENYSETIASKTNFDDFTWSYGGGGGIMFRIGRDLGSVDNLFLDLKVRYLYGTKAEYLTEDGVYVDYRGDTYFDVQKSKTDFLFFHIGVVATFNLYNSTENQ